jgi:hypothetical protein
MSNKDLILNAVSKSKPRQNRMRDGIEVHDDTKSRYVNFEDIGGNKKRRRKTPDRIESWVPADFVNYAKKLYYERYEMNWTLQYARACMDITEIKDNLLEAIGYCDNQLLKQYIEWFFERQADRDVEGAEGFYFGHLYNKKHIEYFASNYLDKNISQSEPETENVEVINPKDIELIYLLSEDQLVIQYGILIAVNWLIEYKGYSLQSAAYSVCNVCKKSRGSRYLTYIKEATEQYNPYPRTLQFKQADQLIKKVDNNMSINVEFGENLNLAELFT